MSVVRSPSTNPPPQVRPVLPLMNREDLPADGSPAQITTRNGQRDHGVIATTGIFGRLAELERRQEQQGYDPANIQTDLTDLASIQTDLANTQTDLANTQMDLNNLLDMSWSIHYNHYNVLSAQLQDLRNDSQIELNNLNAHFDVHSGQIQDLRDQRMNCPVCDMAVPNMRTSCGYMICGGCLDTMKAIGHVNCPLLLCRKQFSSLARHLFFG